MYQSIILATLGMTLFGAAQAQEPAGDANKVVLESQKLAEGVFAVIPEGADQMSGQGLAIATTSGFVIGTDGVLVIDDIEPTDADLLVGEGGSLSVNLGGITVAIHDYGFAQTGADLFVSVPEANVLWTGNPIISTAPAVPWLLDGHHLETRDTLQTVYAAYDSQTKVVPGNGPVTSIDAIQWNIDYLNAVETGVRASIADGLSLEDTVARVQLPVFQGYSLFAWVHPGLNVPAAYRDLK